MGELFHVHEAPWYLCFSSACDRLTLICFYFKRLCNDFFLHLTRVASIVIHILNVTRLARQRVGVSQRTVKCHVNVLLRNETEKSAFPNDGNRFTVFDRKKWHEINNEAVRERKEMRNARQAGNNLRPIWTVLCGQANDIHFSLLQNDLIIFSYIHNKTFHMTVFTHSLLICSQYNFLVFKSTRRVKLRRWFSVACE